MLNEPRYGRIEKPIKGNVKEGKQSMENKMSGPRVYNFTDCLKAMANHKVFDGWHMSNHSRYLCKRTMPFVLDARGEMRSSTDAESSIRSYFTDKKFFSKSDMSKSDPFLEFVRQAENKLLFWYLDGGVDLNDGMSASYHLKLENVRGDVVAFSSANAEGMFKNVCKFLYAINFGEME